jgi:hypothetical protein
MAGLKMCVVIYFVFIFVLFFEFYFTSFFHPPLSPI